ncbi:MAG: SLATT domain-containing protein [Candidatus Krumholzibacteria bacterium]|nr:SLATT domain-containing protein [Candidatus Krumholzibacteria bacterium]
MSESKRRDLEPRGLRGLSWEPDNIQTSLDTVFEHVTRKAKEAIEWYLQSKRRKKRGAVLFRVGAILFGAVAGILPMLAQIFVNEGRPVIQPAWASVSLGVMGALVLLDRFFGFSNGWMRYMSAELSLHQLLEEFQIEWQTEKVKWKGTVPGEEQVQKMLACAKTFCVQVNKVVQEETNAWINEFRSTLKLIDEAAKTKETVSKPGGLNIVVTNGDECDSGWSLSVDGGSSRKCIGRTAAVGDIVPGTHTLSVNGIIDGKPRQAEILANVPAGGIGTAELTLS